MLYNAEVNAFLFLCSIPLYENNGIMALICIYLSFSEAAYLFMCLLAIFSPSLWSVDFTLFFLLDDLSDFLIDF